MERRKRTPTNAAASNVATIIQSITVYTMLLGKNSLWNKLVQSLMKPYVLHNPKKATLIFYYGIKSFYYGIKSLLRIGSIWEIPENIEKEYAVPWCVNGIKKVVFDPSFRKFQPHSTREWFSGLDMLTTIEGLENIDCSFVTDMSIMFYGCSSLTTLDLSNFDTSEDTYMKNMFSRCSSLATLYISSNFNILNVKYKENIFYRCYAKVLVNVNRSAKKNI